MNPSVQGPWRRWWQRPDGAWVASPIDTAGWFTLHRMDFGAVASVDALVRGIDALRTRPHRHVAQVRDVGVVDGAAHWVTDIAPGEPLGRALNRARHTRAPFSIADAARRVRELAAGVTHLRATGTHRGHLDLLDARQGPEGMLLVDAWRLAAEPVGAFTGRSAIAPAVRALAPEVIRGVAWGAPADVWSLGLVLYESVFAERAFRGDTFVEEIMQVVTAAPPRLDTPGPLPPGLVSVLRAALSKDPALRPPNPDALALALAPFAADTSPAAAVYRVDPRAPVAAAAAAQDLPRAAALLAATPALCDGSFAKWLWRSLAAALVDALRGGDLDEAAVVLLSAVRDVARADLRALRADTRLPGDAHALLDALVEATDPVVAQGPRRVRVGLLEVETCPRAWESLRETADPSVRRCDACGEDVTRAQGDGLGALAAGARCVHWRP
jgi:hypothetical protein